MKRNFHTKTNDRSVLTQTVVSFYILWVGTVYPHRGSWWVIEARRVKGLKYDRETLQTGLHELLVSLFRKRPQLSYFQVCGYSFLAAYIHLIMFIGIPWYRYCVFFNTTTGITTRMCRKAELTPCQRLYGVRLRASNRTVEVLYFGCPYVWGWHLYTRVTKNLLHLADPDYSDVLQQCVPSLLKVQRRHLLTIPKEFSSAILRAIQFVNPICAWHAHTTSHPTRFRLSIMPSSNSCCLSSGRSKSRSFLTLYNETDRV